MFTLVTSVFLPLGFLSSVGYPSLPSLAIRKKQGLTKYLVLWDEPTQIHIGHNHNYSGILACIGADYKRPVFDHVRVFVQSGRWNKKLASEVVRSDQWNKGLASEEFRFEG